VSSHSSSLTQTSAQTLVPKQLEELIRTIKILIVDDDYHMRKVVRAMLSAIGVREIFDASDGMSGLQAICVVNPDIVLLDWEMPNISGADFIRSVRSPGAFPAPNIPIIVLTGHGERSCVVTATELGANEYLLKPVSTKALFDRLASVLTRPRPMVRIGDYYGPKPRKKGPFVPEPLGIEQIMPTPPQPLPPVPREQPQNRADAEKRDIGNRDNIVLI
jgi:two-component system, chemotaxis family, chemotaxis protein CheY